jgi:surface antigen
MSRKLGFAAVWLVCMALFSSGAALAQIGANLDLRDSDIAMIRATAAPLYENQATPVGTTASWSNSQTGNSGTVTLVSITTANGVECRRLSHVFRIRGKGDPFNFLVDRCLIDGEWKVYP